MEGDRFLKGDPTDLTPTQLSSGAEEANSKAAKETAQQAPRDDTTATPIKNRRNKKRSLLVLGEEQVGSSKSSAIATAPSKSRTIATPSSNKNTTGDEGLVKKKITSIAENNRQEERYKEEEELFGNESFYKGDQQETAEDQSGKKQYDAGVPGTLPDERNENIKDHVKEGGNTSSSSPFSPTDGTIKIPNMNPSSLSLAMKDDKKRQRIMSIQKEIEQAHHQIDSLKREIARIEEHRQHLIQSIFH